jgi:hypothetical protein
MFFPNGVVGCIKSAKTAYRGGTTSTLLTPGGFFHSVSTISESSAILFMDESSVSVTGLLRNKTELLSVILRLSPDHHPSLQNTPVMTCLPID